MAEYSYLDGLASKFKNSFGTSGSNTNVMNNKYADLVNNTSLTPEQYATQLGGLNTEALNIGGTGGFDTIGDSILGNNATGAAGIGMKGLGLASTAFDTFTTFSNARTAKKLANESISASRESRQQKADEIDRINAQTAKNNTAFGGN